MRKVTLDGGSPSDLKGHWLSDSGRHTADGVNCVYLMPDEDVVCAWTDWKHCTHGHQINGENCIIKRDSQAVVCKHNNYQGFGGQGCDCASRVRPLDGLFVRLLNPQFPDLTPQTDSAFWKQAAVIVMDMWDKHKDAGAALRISQMAPAINDFVCLLRDRGALIVHSPSERGVYSTEPGDTKAYHITDAQQAARQRALDAAHYADRWWKRWQWYYIGDRNPENKEFDFVIHNAHMADQRNDMPGNDVDNYDYPWPNQTNVFTGEPQFQTKAIPILATDAICADGLKGVPNYPQDAYQEILGLTADRPYLIYCGVNTNWCILRRHNGMRTMARAGKAQWIVRDLTDASLGASTTGLTDYATQWDDTGARYQHEFRSGGPQAYNHFEGTDLVVDWIGRTLGAATWTSARVTGKSRFVIPGDSADRVWPRVG